MEDRKEYTQEFNGQRVIMLQRERPAIGRQQGTKQPLGPGFALRRFPKLYLYLVGRFCERAIIQ
jgi:hypothetical protein